MFLTLKYILNHPLTKAKPIKAMLGFAKWQIFSRINKAPVVYNFTSNSKLYVWNGLAGATGNIYCGLHEFEDMAFLLHFLRKGDLFVDVGANIGSYTVLASAEVGANTIALEPVKTTFESLLNNIRLNNISSKVEALNIGAGSKKDILKFTKSLDTGNRVAHNYDGDFESINVDSLDNVLIEKVPLMLKIDVEGFETEVLNGAREVLKSEELKAIVIELNGAGSQYGYDDEEVHLLLLKKGFKSYKYLPFERKFIATGRNKEHNTLYLRDISFINKRVIEGKIMTVKGVDF